MEGNEGGGDNPPTSNKRPRVEDRGGDPKVDFGVGGGGERNDSYLPFFKPNYKRLYPENSANTEFKVFVEATNKDRLGNKSPIYLNHVFATEIKGVTAIQRVNANKIAVIFKQYNTANNFIKNSSFLEKYDMRAFIPAAQIEKTGIIRFVPANISNKELYSRLSSIYEIIAIRRFTKKVGHEHVPLQTVSITFLSNILPDNVQYDLFSYRVFEYIPPLQQCFKCFKFNHSAKICNSKQKCSICGGEHLYKECDKPTEICCTNCSGPHLAISKVCPIKMKKIMEKKSKITYASATSTKQVNNNDFPPLPTSKTPVYNTVNKSVYNSVNKPLYNSVNKPVNTHVDNVNKQQDLLPLENIKNQIVSNNDVLMALVQTLVELGNKGDNSPTTVKTIKDILIKNLK